MEIYIEIVILDNLVIDALIIFLTCRTVHITPKKRNAALSVFLGVIFALIMPYVILPNVFMVFVKFAFGFCMVFVLAPRQKPKRMAWTYMWFLAYTFLLGGLCFGVAYLLNQNITVTGFVISGFTIPVSIIVLVMGIYIFLFTKSLQLLHKKNGVQTQLYSIIIRQGDCLLHAEAFLDSGNRLYDHGKPVFVISPKIFQTLFHMPVPDHEIPQFLTQAHYLSVKSIGGQQHLLVFTLEELDILVQNRYTKLCKVLVGVSQTNFNQDFDCLLHPDAVSLF